jgi:hypothetical protein
MAPTGTTVTLSEFLLPAPADLATRVSEALADEGVVVRTGGVSPSIPGWRMMAGAVARHLAGVLDIGFLDILVGAWNKSYALGQQLEKSAKSPGKDVFLQLAEHKITSKHEPYLALFHDGQEIGRLPFTVSVELVLQGAVLRIRDGRIEEVETGRIKGKGTVKCGGAILAEKELQPITIPGTMPVGLKGAATQPTTSRLARAS